MKVIIVIFISIVDVVLLSKEAPQRFTCEFDLPDYAQEDLPEHCHKLKAQNGRTYELARDEAVKMNELYKEFKKLEEKASNTTVWALKRKLYNETKLLDCYNTAKFPQDRFFVCLIEKRTKMIEKLKKPISL